MGRTLSEHAAYELTLAGLTDNEDHEAKQTAINIMAMVRRFEKQKNNEKQREFILQALNRLINFLPLTSITDDPTEWEKFEMERKNIETGEVEKKVVWQSKRGASIFSDDEGRTWYDQATGKAGDSVDHVQAAKERQAERDAIAAAKKAQANAGKMPEVPAGADVPAAEMTEILPETPDNASKKPEGEVNG